jgi:lipopolysaccharide/colanic/teichoic acid biosynthesis glycosyltransferase
MTSHTINSFQEASFNNISMFTWFILQRLLACILLLILSPILCICACLICLESRGSALFIQQRVGYQGKAFYIFKFRSMRTESDPNYIQPQSENSDRKGVCKKFKNDPRLTLMGKIIRKTSIDELPQLINVVLGNMALVGPRPALLQEVKAYEPYMLKRLEAMPGITGLWQVSGRANTSFDEQIKLDLRYINQQNIRSDIKILFATIPAVLFAKGAY